MEGRRKGWKREKNEKRKEKERMVRREKGRRKEKRRGREGRRKEGNVIIKIIEKIKFKKKLKRSLNPRANFLKR